MSHKYSVRCERCGAESEEFNHAQAELIRAVRESYPLYLLRQTGWGDDYQALCYGSIYGSGLAAFIVEHFGCGRFLVVSEYWDKDDARRAAEYPPVPVEPDCAAYRAICLERAAREAREAAAHLQALLGRAEGKPNA